MINTRGSYWGGRFFVIVVRDRTGNTLCSVLKNMSYLVLTS